MNAFRSKALTLVAGAATLSLTACTAGVTTASSASSPATSPAAPSRSAAAAASSPGAAPSASTIALSEPPGSFPVPAGAKVADNVVITGTVILFFSGITPAEVLAFYTKALPQAGYKITGSEMVSEAGGTAAKISIAREGAADHGSAYCRLLLLKGVFSCDLVHLGSGR